jgi:phthiocerol/phenolphthiocerol synthesis type-I polyketide synthase E
MNHASEADRTGEVAIIGMAGRFPGAKHIAEYWQNLRAGVESVSFFSEAELASSGVAPAMLSAANYVKARAILEDVGMFDAAFFGFNPREAEIMDPQHRLFLESAWEALECAGYNPDTYKGSIGVYGGSNFSSYLFNLYSNLNIMRLVGQFRALLANDKDYLTTLTSYKLNLKGPSISIQTACSTSLVAVHLACQSLWGGECDLALAGGVSIIVPQKSGYFYDEGGIASPDGHCRTFDQKAQGTISGSGVGVVVLKRLPDALEDGDRIEAIIKASAINNDGALKAGYTAPSLDGQAEVISEAIAVAGVDAETITYVEAHGTATPLGDPIEVAALTKAFRSHTAKTGFCAIGSVKTNIGHLDAAAGVAGLIKTVLALKHKQIPPSLHFEEPNPQIDFASSPFYVNTKLRDWPAGNFIRRAGLSSFGIGGTNAHAILEEAPAPEASGPSRPCQLLLLSAKTATALDAMTQNLAAHLNRHKEEKLADVAYTLQAGRKAFNYRRMLVCSDQQDAARALEAADGDRIFTSYHDDHYRSVVFMFPGQGAQHVNMGLALYENEKTYREQVDQCAEMLKPHLGLDIRQIIYPKQVNLTSAAAQLNQTSITQPALFLVEYALASLLMEWGVKPEAMIGHSIGEYVAACIAGVFSVEDALRLVAARGKMMQRLAGGKMLAIGLSEEEIEPLLGDEISLAAVNAPGLCVASGGEVAITQLEAQLTGKRIFCRRLETSHAFHSHLMEPMLGGFAEEVKRLKLNAPKINYISNVSGQWINVEEATSADYWVRHLRSTVRFSKGVQELMKSKGQVVLEVGPGQALRQIVMQQVEGTENLNVFSCLSQANKQATEMEHLLNAMGQAWMAGVEVDWDGFYAHEKRQRVPLPTYPFERQRYWLNPSQADRAANEIEDRTDSREALVSSKAESLNTGETKQPASRAAAAFNETPGQLTTSPPDAREDETADDGDIPPALERVMAQQLQILAQQLELLRNSDSSFNAADEIGV